MGGVLFHKTIFFERNGSISCGQMLPSGHILYKKYGIVPMADCGWINVVGCTRTIAANPRVRTFLTLSLKIVRPHTDHREM